MAKNNGEMKEYLIKSRDGTRMITIPASWKITYGTLHPGTKGYGGDGNVLRIYETKEKQRAIFTGVETFRDLSIPVKKLVKDRDAMAKVKHEKGKVTSEDKETIADVWIDENPEIEL